MADQRQMDMRENRGARPAEPALEPGGPRHVGEWLKQQREALGYPLPALANSLRIRLIYLQAIEDGRWADLPGAAYSTGFLRSYAQTVGLDPGAVLERYKRDSGGQKPAPELYFPEPVNESRVPGGAVLLIAALLAALVYGGWYIMSGSDRSVGEQVAELPSRLSKLIYGDQISDPAPPPVRVLQPEQVEALVATPPAPPAAETTPPPATTPVPATDAPPATDTSRPTAPAEEESEVPQLPDLGQAPAPAPVTEPADPDVEPVAAGEAPAAPPPPTETAVAHAADVPASGRVFGLAEGPVRVTLKAVEDSWVEIRDGKGTLWASRVLRRGDVFRAPDVPGLVLDTGNAGGLIVTLDGRDLPPLGAKSQVLRNIDITAASLAAR